VRDLAARGVPVRAFVRDPDRAAERSSATSNWRWGDLSDAASIAARSTAWTACSSPRATARQGRARERGRRRRRDGGRRAIVKASTVMAKAGSPLPGLDWNGRIENHLRGFRRAGGPVCGRAST
jgi:uncharacterized protein YbjT (DUF2867 family)